MANVDGEAGSPVTRGNVAGILNAFESPVTLRIHPSRRRSIPVMPVERIRPWRSALWVDPAVSNTPAPESDDGQEAKGLDRGQHSPPLPLMHAA